jgi:hypothetical protein
MKGRRCHAATFDSYRQMLAHCRQHHPDSLPCGGDPTTELVVTDTQGKVLSWEEIGQILDDPTFWQEPLMDDQAIPLRKTRRSIFPAALTGNSFLNSMMRGTL